MFKTVRKKYYYLFHSKTLPKKMYVEYFLVNTTGMTQTFCTQREQKYFPKLTLNSYVWVLLNLVIWTNMWVHSSIKKCCANTMIFLFLASFNCKNPQEWLKTACAQPVLSTQAMYIYIYIYIYCVQIRFWRLGISSMELHV